MIRIVMDDAVVLRVEGTDEPVVVFEPYLDGLDEEEVLHVMKDPGYDDDVAYCTYAVDSHSNFTTTREVTYETWQKENE